MNLPLPTGEVDFVSERSEFTKSGEGIIFKMLNRAKKKCAFTLSEVLIVLAVLGVIAAMTIPDLIQDAREKALITALKKNYTVFSQAVDMAIAENGPPNTWDIGEGGSGVGALKLYDILKPCLRIGEECNLSKGCFANYYEALYKASETTLGVLLQPAEYGKYAKGVLSSGVSFNTWSAGTGCPNNSCGIIAVDVNGKAGPNTAGMDYFYFFISPDGLFPAGQTYVDYGSSAAAVALCRYHYYAQANGLGCTYWALKHENMDYLRKDGWYYGYAQN